MGFVPFLRLMCESPWEYGDNGIEGVVRWVVVVAGVSVSVVGRAAQKNAGEVKISNFEVETCPALTERSPKPLCPTKSTSADDKRVSNRPEHLNCTIPGVKPRGMRSQSHITRG